MRVETLGEGDPEVGLEDGLHGGRTARLVAVDATDDGDLDVRLHREAGW